MRTTFGAVRPHREGRAGDRRQWLYRARRSTALPRRAIALCWAEGISKPLEQLVAIRTKTRSFAKSSGSAALTGPKIREHSFASIFATQFSYVPRGWRAVRCDDPRALPIHPVARQIDHNRVLPACRSRCMATTWRDAVMWRSSYPTDIIWGVRPGVLRAAVSLGALAWSPPRPVRRQRRCAGNARLSRAPPRSARGERRGHRSRRVGVRSTPVR